MTAVPPQVPRAALLALEHAILERVATGTTLAEALDHLCRRVEEMAPGVVATILAVRDGKMHPIASPSMPAAFSHAVDGAPIGPAAGACGTAAWRGERVEVHDIGTDPLWRDYHDLPLPPDLVACWSSPIKSRQGSVIGTFAFYYREKRGPARLETMIVETCVHLCAIAIENDMAWSETRRLAFEDTVTGLMNRSAFQVRAAGAIAEARAGGTAVAFHVIDVDEFKGVNDSLGHEVGDLLLAAVAKRLRGIAGEEGEVARIGGDEFAILQPNATRDAAADLVWRCLDAFAVPFRVDDRQITVNASIGIAIAPEDGSSLTQVLRNADLALYGAKSAGRGRHRFFTSALADAVRQRRAMGEELKRAIDQNELAVVFQPIIDLGTGAPVGAEALLRWRSETPDEVLPEVFVPLAEELGLIHRIGAWVAAEACRQAVRWPEHFTISVNISPIQLRPASFAADFSRIVAEAGLTPDRVVVEITETAVLNDDAPARDSLMALKAAGFTLALDDFGTGYSSLKSLRAVPIDKIKIDKSFIAEFGLADASTSIVRAVVALARSMGIATTAEGIETAERARRLAAEGCDEGQGFYFSRPLAADAMFAYASREDRRKAVAGSRATA